LIVPTTGFAYLAAWSNDCLQRMQVANPMEHSKLVLTGVADAEAVLVL